MSPCGESLWGRLLSSCLSRRGLVAHTHNPSSRQGVAASEVLQLHTNLRPAWTTQCQPWKSPMHSSSIWLINMRVILPPQNWVTYGNSWLYLLIHFSRYYHYYYCYCSLLFCFLSRTFECDEYVFLSSSQDRHALRISLVTFVSILSYPIRGAHRSRNTDASNLHHNLSQQVRETYPPRKWLSCLLCDQA